MILLCITSGHAQEEKSCKNLLDISFQAWSPEVSNRRAPEFNVYKDGNVVPGKDVFDWGARIGYTRMISPRFGIGLEAGIDMFSIHTEKRGYLAVDTYYEVNFENRDAYSLSAMPVFSFHHAKEWKPGRMVHRIGAAVRYSDLVYKKYHSQTTPHNSSTGALPPYPSHESSPAYKLTYEDGENMGLVFMYSLGLEKQINRFLSFHYGVRFTYNYVPSPVHYYEESFYWYYSNDGPNAFAYYVNKRTQWQYLRAYAGLTFKL